MPTGGVTTDEENIKEWFRAGVACVGMGSNLVSSKLVEEEKYNEISAITERVLKIIKNIRGF
jgi:2-dehydro-3-deoxyphosphogluconate aldolase/(4S)-4-hydroxy-2-oxoglutarate aldolase